MFTLQKSAIALIISALLFGQVAADATITKGEAFQYLADKVDKSIVDSYKYIDLHYQGVDENSVDGRALQKLVYLGLINNTNTKLSLSQKINFYTFEAFVTKVLQLKIAGEVSVQSKKNTYVTQSDLGAIDALLKERESVAQPILGVEGLPESSKILTDVYKTLNDSYYDKKNINQEQLIQGAIKGAADSLGDKYTTYFPPVESKNFTENLDGSFQGIGAYIDMPSPGELIIVSPMVGSPAEKAGIKGGDRVLAVDGKNITPENPVSEVITWIKGPKGTEVKLKIKRKSISESFTISVVRDTIVVKDVEYEKLSKDSYYIQIKSFGTNVTKEFKQALEVIAADKQAKKIIFDLRNNPGGYLNEVSYMLSYFIPKGEATAIIDYGDSDMEYTSRGYELLHDTSYDFVFLQNGGSASASEIMIGTMKDYYPTTKIIGEKSFGKGSVQSLKNYYDGSTLKYTTAKWFTGKTKTGIDGVGITPDIEILFDRDLYQEQEIDNQLEAAKRN